MSEQLNIAIGADSRGFTEAIEKVRAAVSKLPDTVKPGMDKMSAALRSAEKDFRNLASEVTRAAGRDAVKVTYAYVADVGVGSLTQLPVVVKAVDTLVPVGERLYVLRYEAEATVFEDDLSSYEQALSALVLPGGAQ